MAFELRPPRPSGHALAMASGSTPQRSPSSLVLGGSAIDFLAVADLHNINEKSRVVDGVYDSVAALANTVSIPLISELLATARARLLRQR